MPADQRAGSQIHLRVTRQRKAAYVRKASSEKITLAEWMFQQCDAAANFTPEEQPDLSERGVLVREEMRALSPQEIEELHQKNREAMLNAPPTTQHKFGDYPKPWT